MPCNSDYMQSNELEIRTSQVYCLLNEIKTGVPVNPQSNYWQGYHPEVYCKATRQQSDQVVAELCNILSKKKSIKKYSLEMQIWWREHQQADARRLQKEQEKQEQEKLKKQALNKLSAKEKKALGI